MTVKLLMDWPDSRDGKNYLAGNLLTTDAGTESGLVAAKMATSTLAGGTAYVPPVVQKQRRPVEAEFDAVTGRIIKTAGGIIDAGSPLGPSPLKPTMMLVGNSIARLQRVNGYAGGANQVGGYGWLWWAMSFLGWPLEFVLTGSEVQVGASVNSSMRDGIYGFSGGTSVDILGQLPAAVGANRPAVLFFHTMENDPVSVDAGTITIAQVASAYAEQIAYANSIGAQPVWIGCLPSSDYGTAGKKAAYYACEQAAIAACAEGGAIYVPTWDLYTDSSSAYPVPLNSGSFANMVFTNVHPMQAGVLIGVRVADVLERYGYSIINEPINAAHASPKLIHGNALMSGSGGFLTGGYTGAAPATVTILTDAANISSATSTVNPVGGHQEVVADISVGAQTGIKALVQAYTTTYSTTGFAVGDRVSMFCDMKINSSSNLRVIEGSIAFQNGTDYPVINAIASGDDVVLPIPIGRKMRIRTPIVAVTAGTTGLRQTTKLLAKNNAATAAVNATIYGYGVINHSAP